MKSGKGNQARQRQIAVNQAVLRLVRLIRKRGTAEEAGEAAALEEVINQRLRGLQKRNGKPPGQ